MSALCQKRTHAVQHRTDGHGRLAAALERPYPRPITRCPPIGMERCLDLRRCSSSIHVIGDYVMDSNNRIGRRERFEILKIVQGLGEGVIAVDKGQLKPLRPNTILGALQKSIARRNREGRMWPAFLDLFWIGRRVDDPPPSAHQR